MKTQKELKDEYKQKKFKIGVFQIRNTVNGKIFIGSNVNLDAIWNRHQLQLNVGSHPSPDLQSDWKTYGEQAFKFEILAEVQQKEGETGDYSGEMKDLELMFLEELKPYGDKGYNKPPKKA